MAEKVTAGGLIGAMVFLSASIGFAYVATQVAREPGTCGSEPMAFIMSQAPVSDMLKSPATAEFPSSNAPGVSIQRIEDCKFRVSAFVDSENGFGAMIRSPYTAELIHNKEGGGWAVTSLSIQ